LSCLFADYSQSDANEQGVSIDTVARWVWSGSQARPGRNCLREYPSFQGLSARGQVRTTSHWTVARCTVWVFRVPCNCRPCMRPAGSQHTSELSTRQGSPIRVVRRLVETRQEDDDVRMLLFVGTKVLRVVTGSRDQSEEPYYRDVRMPAAGAVSVGRDIMPGTTLKPHGNRLVAIVTKNRVSAVRCPHAIRLSYRQ